MSGRWPVKHASCGWQGYLDEINFVGAHYWVNDRRTRTYYVECPHCPSQMRLVIQGDKCAATILEGG